MKRAVFLSTMIIALSCGHVEKPNSIEMITGNNQNTLFHQLLATTNNNLPEAILNDSLAILVLPVQASCPSCRNKTIDSIVKHQNNLDNNHFIVISAKGGRKMMNSYFKEQGAEIPDLPHQIILDSTNLASQYELFDDNPAFYYTANRKVYKKVWAKPATVRQDLQEFFSGYRSKE